MKIVVDMNMVPEIMYIFFIFTFSPFSSHFFIFFG